jgi:hypothetical protein
MKKKLATLSALAGALVVFSHPLLAHHGTSSYDFSKTVTLNGTITGFDWANPHCLIHIDVKNDDGNVQHWTLELPSTFTMARRGWTKDSLRLRDQAVVETHPAKNGTAVGISWMPGSLMKVVANGKAMPTQ